MSRNLFNTGDDRVTITDAEKLAAGAGTSNAFNITWAAFKALLNTAGFFKSGDALSASTGNFSGVVSVDGDFNAIKLSSDDFILFEISPLGSGVNLDNAYMTLKSDGSDEIIFSAANGSGNFSGIVTASGFVPFTGCHIAKSNEDLKLGELVSLNSYGKYTSEKQPDWLAEYCSGSKGNYGIVYAIEIVPIMEDYEETVITKRLLLPNKSEVVTKQRKTGEYTQYLIACVGDAGGIAGIQVTNENGNLECGDYLIPSNRQGFAKKYIGDYVPLNHCGKIGEDIIFAVNETERIGCAWLKE